ncbi:MAG: LytTR family transcriptional regulator DNA-binding domain-containing protein [Bacillota bacterium]
MVNIEHVEEVITWFNGSYILKIGDNEIPVSRSRTGELKNLLGI